MERRKKEAVAVARWKGQPSAHSLLVSYVIDGLERDLRAMAKTTVVSLPELQEGREVSEPICTVQQRYRHAQS